MLQSLFLHYFDAHFLEEVAGSHTTAPHVRRELSLATRLALLAADEILVPAASYFERLDCREVVNQLEPAFEAGVIYLVGGGSSSEEYLESKLDQYRPGSEQRQAYEDAARAIIHHPPFRSRQRSTTEDIIVFWQDTLEMPNFPTAVFGKQIQLPTDLEVAWAAAPERLGQDAFIVEYVQPLVFGEDTNLIARNRLHGVINQGYFASYARELGAGLVIDLVYLASRHALTSGGPDLPLKAFRDTLRSAGVLAEAATESAMRLLELRHDPRVVAALSLALSQAPGVPYEQAQLELALQAPPDLRSMLQAVLTTQRGKRGATKYHRAIERLLSALFGHSLVDPRVEERLDRGTRRVDILYRNASFTGFFRWIHQTYTAPYVVIECKNYTDDIANQQLDQVTGYFAPWRTKVGFLVCRSLRNRQLMIDRCRYAAHAGRGIVVVLEDADLERLAAGGIDPRWNAFQSRYLAARVDEIVM